MPGAARAFAATSQSHCGDTSNTSTAFADTHMHAHAPTVLLQDHSTGPVHIFAQVHGKMAKTAVDILDVRARRGSRGGLKDIESSIHIGEHFASYGKCFQCPSELIAIVFI